jgi:hypothetical protein
MRRILIFALLGAGVISSGPQASSADLRVLFIGNSLTSVNDLPQIVEAIAEAGGKGRIRAHSVTANNFSLEDHWNSGPARQTIERGRWDWVVLQQGPSSQPDSQAMLREHVKRFDGLIRKVNAKTALYMVWPARARYGDMKGVITSYTNAAADVGAALLPAGLAWDLGLQREPALPLYGDDQFHPSILGSYLAALVIYEGLTGEPTAGLRAAVRERTLTPPRLQLLTDVAHQAVTLNRQREK